ncbi:MAG: glucosaminidase domain-containing protein [Rhodospirillaceae bacterium]|nr:glucosaminidase domain-containing protein [Rhodospirillaceae bacterium]
MLTMARQISALWQNPTVRVGTALAAAAVVALGTLLFIRERADESVAPIFKQWSLELSADPLSVAQVETAFAEINYDFARVKQGLHPVPRVLVRSVPEDLGQVPEVTRRKSLFLGSVLPLVLAVNEQIMAERRALEDIAGKIRARQPLSDADIAEVNRLAKIYRLGGDAEETVADVSDTALLDELLLRVAPMPVSMALAQAAEESAWGLSRFASEGNALYGQWVWNDKAGMVPTARGSDETHSVRAFRDILESTLSYAHNLNTHWAYEDFRKMRANMLNSSGRLDGAALAGTLTRYSGRGQAYVESLRGIIRSNGLAALDQARFAAPALQSAGVRTADAGLAVGAM